MDEKLGPMNVSTYSAIRTVKYSLAAKISKISKKQKIVQLFQREDKLKSPVLKNVVTKIWNTKKSYVEKLKGLKNSSSASSSSNRVTKKAILKTATEVETALKTKLVSERSMKNKENDNESAPEKSPTATMTNNISEEIIPTKKTKTVQSSLNSCFQRKSVWFFFFFFFLFL